MPEPVSSSVRLGKRPKQGESDQNVFCHHSKYKDITSKSGRGYGGGESGRGQGGVNVEESEEQKWEGL